MPSELMVRQTKATGNAYTLADPDDGLTLFVSADGAKTWPFRFTWGGKRDRLSFGILWKVSIFQRMAYPSTLSMASAFERPGRFVMSFQCSGGRPARRARHAQALPP